MNNLLISDQTSMKSLLMIDLTIRHTSKSNDLNGMVCIESAQFEASMNFAQEADIGIQFIDCVVRMHKIDMITWIKSHKVNFN